MWRNSKSKIALSTYREFVAKQQGLVAASCCAGGRNDFESGCAAGLLGDLRLVFQR